MRLRNISRLTSALVAGLMCISLSTFGVFAEGGQSLDEVLNSGGNEVVQEQEPVEQAPVEQEPAEQAPADDGAVGGINDWVNDEGGGSIIDEMKGGADLSGTSAGATQVNKGIKKVASLIAQVLSYAITVLLVVRVLLDLAYVALPFFRGFLGGAAAQQGGAPGMAGGMNGGMNSSFGGGMNSSFGGGMGGFGANRGGMGMGMGMNGQQQQGGSRLQLVSNAALNAVQTPTPYKTYAKDMMVVLIITPIFLVLAVSGVLVDLGFMIGDAITSIVSGIGGML